MTNSEIQNGSRHVDTFIPVICGKNMRRIGADMLVETTDAKKACQARENASYQGCMGLSVS